MSLKLTLTKFLPYVWLLLLLGALLVSAQAAYRKSLNTEEYPYACDSFGYLRMAKDIREAAAQGRRPQFKLESEQTRLLIEFMKAKNVSLPLWEEVVAPHAHHYFPKSDSVGVQYPPGTGLMLAIFPEGRAIYTLNKLVVLVLVLTGIGALIFAGWRKAWLSAGLAILGIQIGLSILGRIGAVSFSINVTILPTLLSVILVLLTIKLTASNRLRWAWAAALAAGLFIGFAVMVRLPTILLAPGLALLLWPRSRVFSWRNPVLPFMLGILALGLAPVFWYQQEIAGAWYLPTYGRMDATLPTLERIRHHFAYYFKEGFGAEDNWALINTLIAFAGIFILAGFRKETAPTLGVGYRRLALATLLVWLLPTVFFLSHATHGLHYTMPGTFATVLIAGFGALAIEGGSTLNYERVRKSSLRWAAGLALIVISAAATFEHEWRAREARPAPVYARAHDEKPLPPELADPKVWIWADLLTGTFWYYHHRPAFKIQFTDREIREIIFKFVFERGERQYLVQDSERMQKYMDEIVALGGSLEPKGQINDAPYFLVHWPAAGPNIRSQQITQR